jgi:hypothetical protein
MTLSRSGPLIHSFPYNGGYRTNESVYTAPHPVAFVSSCMKRIRMNETNRPHTRLNLKRRHARGSLLGTGNSGCQEPWFLCNFFFGDVAGFKAVNSP